MTGEAKIEYRLFGVIRDDATYQAAITVGIVSPAETGSVLHPGDTVALPLPVPSLEWADTMATLWRNLGVEDVRVESRSISDWAPLLRLA